ncbi:MAG: hypothetical protein LC672_06845, partial [Acidobacteria bacterium]|nr:hypothetical protein [Acidobacteriota bacterium]
MIPNAVLWLPLILVALERARRGRFTACLLGAACAYAMAVLSGIGQGFIFAGALALCYALFLSLARPTIDTEEGARGLLTWARWRPLAVMLAAVLLAAGVAAFQILETLQAARLSVRSTLSYATFSEGSLTFKTVWRSFLLSFYAYEAIDVAAYMAPLAVCLALYGGARALRHPRRDVRVLFWLATAAVAVALMLGAHTPLYRVVYHIPVLNRFRVPARHALEWSFAISVLAAYGWDALAAVVANRRESAANSRLTLVLGLLVVLLACVISVCWWRAVGRSASPYATQYAGLSESSYLLWKAAHTLLVFGGVCLGWRVAAHKWRGTMLCTIMLLACLTEPFI